jgi:uncharacterized UPF0146 family protein
MGGHKRIETCIGAYIAARYSAAVEVGIGKNTVAADIIRDAGKKIRCTDLKKTVPAEGLNCVIDDIFEPSPEIYSGAEVIYAIRPGIEMIPPLISLARQVNADLLVYHLGFELYGDGGETLDCGVLLHRYYCREKPPKRVT